MPNYDEICVLAYKKWEQAGRPCGDGKEFWVTAENELKSKKRIEPLGKAAKKSTTTK